MTTPELIVVGGPNGSGKTTFAKEYLKHYPILYLGADEIAAQLSPENPESAAISASREFSKRIQQAIANQKNVLVESTLSGRSFQRKIQSAKSAGFKVTIFFLWLDSAELSLERVRERVAKGGHDVPESDVRRRFLRCLKNFWELYRPLSDHWRLSYNSGEQLELVAIGDAQDVSVSDARRFAQFQRLIEGA